MDNAETRSDPEFPQARAGYLIWHVQLAGEPLPSLPLQSASVLSSSTLPWQKGAVMHARHPQHLQILVSSIPSTLDTPTGHSCRMCLIPSSLCCCTRSAVPLNANLHRSTPSRGPCEPVAWFRENLGENSCIGSLWGARTGCWPWHSTPRLISVSGISRYPATPQENRPTASDTICCC